MLDHDTISWENLAWAQKLATEKKHICSSAANGYADALQYAIFESAEKTIHIATHNPVRFFQDETNIGKMARDRIRKNVAITMMTDNAEAAKNKDHDLGVLKRYATWAYDDYKIEASLVKALPIVDGHPAEMILCDKHMFIVAEDNKLFYRYSCNHSEKTRKYLQLFQNCMKDATVIDLVHDHAQREETKQAYKKKTNTLAYRTLSGIGKLLYGID